MSKFGKEVKKRLIDLGLTQLALAAEMKVSPSYVAAVLNGHKKPSMDFWGVLERMQMTNHDMEVAFVLERGEISVDGMPWGRVSDLVHAASRIKEGRGF